MFSFLALEFALIRLGDQLSPVETVPRAVHDNIAVLENYVEFGCGVVLVVETRSVTGPALVDLLPALATAFALQALPAR